MSFWKKIFDIFRIKEKKTSEDVLELKDVDDGLFMDLASEVSSIVEVFGEEVATKLYSLLITTFKNVTPEEFRASVGRMIEITKNKDSIEKLSGMSKYELYCLGLTDGISTIRGISKVLLYHSLLQNQTCVVIKMQSLNIFEYKDATFYINGVVYKDPIRVSLFDMEDENNNIYVRTETLMSVSDTDKIKVVSDGKTVFEGSKMIVDSESEGDPEGDLFSSYYDKKDPRYNN